MRILNIDFPKRTHVPDLEREAINQMPKVGWRELKLYRYTNTDIYQWYGKKGINSDAKDWTVFEDPCDGPFQMTPEEGSVSGIVEAAKILAKKWASSANTGHVVGNDEWYRSLHDLFDAVNGSKSMTLAEFVASANKGGILESGAVGSRVPGGNRP